MKNSRPLIGLASLILALLALCWSPAQPPTQRLKVIDDKGAEVHTLMSDQYNVLVDYLETTGQTNALELFRQFRCAHNAETSASELRETVEALQHLRAGRTTNAIRLLEQHLTRHVHFMCNSYGCLNSTNRAGVKLESLDQAQNYYDKFPSAELSAETKKGVRLILKPWHDAEAEKAVEEILRGKVKPGK